MKRSWMFALFLAGTLAVLTAPASAKENGDVAATSLSASDQDTSVEALREDLNTALGTQASRLNAIEKQLGLKIFGDVRTRYMLRSQLQSNQVGAAAVAANAGVSVIPDQSVGRFRARLGAMETAGDIAGGMRISTGSGNANSENQTFDTGFQDPAIILDLAYLSYTPGFLDKHLTLTAGKMPNPLTKTDMMWDPDICPEGVAGIIDFGGDTKLKAAYFDLANPAGAPTAPTTLNPQANTDMYMVNAQLEKIFKLDATHSLGLMAGFEYIPWASALAHAQTPYQGPATYLTSSNVPLGAGNILDYNNGLPDFEVGEFMLTLKHAKNAMDNGDFPMALTVHLIDNFNSFDVPAVPGYVYNTKYTIAQQIKYGYTSWTNQYGFYVEVSAGDTQKGNMLGKVACSYVEPNAQLAELASDDANFTNTQYLFEQIGYGLEDNVVLLLSAWEEQNIYQVYGATNNLLTNNGNGKSAQMRGNSLSPEVQLYADCVLSL